MMSRVVSSGRDSECRDRKTNVTRKVHHCVAVKSIYPHCPAAIIHGFVLKVAPLRRSGGAKVSLRRSHLKENSERRFQLLRSGGKAFHCSAV